MWGPRTERAQGLYQFPGAVMTKNHRLGGFNNRNMLSHSSGGWKSKVKVSAGLVLSWVSASIPGLPSSFWWPQAFSDL